MKIKEKEKGRQGKLKIQKTPYEGKGSQKTKKHLLTSKFKSKKLHLNKSLRGF